MNTGIYGKVAALLAAIAAVSLGLTALLAPHTETASTLTVATGFYPVTVAVNNITDGVDGVTVMSMADSNVGCLHDYQMSPRDRRVLDAADILVIHGAGAEPYLDAVIPQMTVPIVDLSEGQPLLESGHVHTHGHAQEHTEEAAVNGHLWVSPLRYRQEIETLTAALCEHDPAHAAQYRANAAAYINDIDAVWARMQQAVAPFEETPTVLFHDSLAYLAEDLGLNVVAALNIGEDNGASAKDLALAEDALTGTDEAMLLYDAQYGDASYRYLQDLPARAVVAVGDIAATGEGDRNAWLDAMNAWCDSWEAAV